VICYVHDRCRDAEQDDSHEVRGLRPVLDERVTRLRAGAEADALGDGGIAIVARATGLLRTTIRAGRDELLAGATTDDVVWVRRPGSGRPRIETEAPEILDVLETLVDPVTRGDPESPLRLTSKSTRKLAEELGTQGYVLSRQKVRQLLRARGYSLQATRKTIEGTAHPDRNAQFEYINDRVDTFHARGAPVISVGTKKKELVGRYANGGREWQPQGTPERVRVHDFIDDRLGKVIPYGVYDLAQNTGWVNVGIDHDTPAFAVESIARWWRGMGKKTYPSATTCSLPQMPAAAIARARERGKSSTNASRIGVGSRSASRTFRLARPSGTRSNTGSSPTSRRTGEAGPSSITRRSGNSLAACARPPGSP
jgi:hypothetical protein